MSSTNVYASRIGRLAPTEPLQQRKQDASVNTQTASSALTALILYLIYFHLNNILWRSSKSTFALSATIMGASESKLVFRQGIFRLSEERSIPADDPYWASVSTSYSRWDRAITL